jgi:glycopeptide antibiotics resistance protein
MAGLLKVYLSINKIWARVLSVIYLIGILCVGLSPRSRNYTQYKVLFDVNNFGWHDFSINTVGFIPLGYLLMLGFGNGQKDKRGNLFRRAIILSGVGGLISLLLEVSQYYLISGRHSSFIDLTANTIGTLIGIAMYLAVEQERTHKAHEILDSS